MPYLNPRVILGILLAALVFGAGWCSRQATLTTVEELEATKAEYEAALATAEAAHRSAQERADEHAERADEHAERAAESARNAEVAEAEAEGHHERVAELEAELAKPIPAVVIAEIPPAVRRRLVNLEGALSESRGEVSRLRDALVSRGDQIVNLESALSEAIASRDWQIEATAAAERGKEIAEERVLEYEKATQSRLRTVVGATGGWSAWPERGNWWAGVGVTLGWTIF